jgi:hypothetical protein
MNQLLSCFETQPQTVTVLYRKELRELLNSELERAQEVLGQEAESRQRVEQESAATKEAVEEAIKDIEALDAERTDLRTRLRV